MAAGTLVSPGKRGISQFWGVPSFMTWVVLLARLVMATAPTALDDVMTFVEVGRSETTSETTLMLSVCNP